MEEMLGGFATEALKLGGAGLIAIIVREFAGRVRSGTKRLRAEDDAQVSVLGGSLQREAQLQKRNDDLTLELDRVKADLGEARARMTVAQLLAAGDKAGAAAFAEQSGFTDFDRPLRPRPRMPVPPPATSSMDPFHSANPFDPPMPKKPRRT